MYLLIHQNNDLCELTGYPFATLPQALHSAGLMIGNGLAFEMVDAVVKVENGPELPCHLVKPCGSKVGDPFVREGQMTVVAQVCYAADVAVRLTRRHKGQGVGRVEIVSDRPYREPGRPWVGSKTPSY